MRRFALILFMLAGCHAHQVAQDKRTMASEEAETPGVQAKEINSPRPVRTTPGGYLDAQAVRKIQRALAEKGVTVHTSGVLDEPTQHAIRAFQKREQQPATGYPDFGTLKLLGLDADDIYVGGKERKSGEVK